MGTLCLFMDEWYYTLYLLLISGWSLGYLFLGLFLTGAHSPISRPDTHHVVSCSVQALSMWPGSSLPSIQRESALGQGYLKCPSLYLAQDRSARQILSLNFLEVLCGLISPSIFPPPHI